MFSATATPKNDLEATRAKLNARGINYKVLNVGQKILLTYPLHGDKCALIFFGWDKKAIPVR